ARAPSRDGRNAERALSHPESLRPELVRLLGILEPRLAPDRKRRSLPGGRGPRRADRRALRCCTARALRAGPLAAVGPIRSHRGAAPRCAVSTGQAAGEPGGAG